ncbi:hypothetical protein BJ878DRAFT_575383 [Calycina marina]|uniref:Uncharacterized protein n=1 Tax=Calycina marina TaxID=1763456 RepID=A0A9P7Z3D2_9HELO|nr:hypothetical protein BJ878DRAFT_575383 [Calycina marina]
MNCGIFEKLFIRSFEVMEPVSMKVNGAVRQWITYFDYGGYFDTAVVEVLCPSARRIGLGYLNDWTWYINKSGVPNIRPRDDEFENINTWQGPVIHPMCQAPDATNQKIGTYGFIYMMSVEDFDHLDQLRGGVVNGRLRSIELLEDHTYLQSQSKTARPRAKSKIKRMAAYLHWDSALTADGCIDFKWDYAIEANGSVNSKVSSVWVKWQEALYKLRVAGVPENYIAKLHVILRGGTSGADQQPVYSESTVDPALLLQLFPVTAFLDPPTMPDSVLTVDDLSAWLTDQGRVPDYMIEPEAYQAYIARKEYFAEKDEAPAPDPVLAPAPILAPAPASLQSPGTKKCKRRENDLNFNKRLRVSGGSAHPRITIKEQISGRGRKRKAEGMEIIPEVVAAAAMVVEEPPTKKLRVDAAHIKECATPYLEKIGFLQVWLAKSNNSALVVQTDDEVRYQLAIEMHLEAVRPRDIDIEPCSP